MSDKISALTEQTSGTLHDDDLLVNVDVSDTTMAASGTNKKSKWSSIKATLKTYFDTLYAAASHTHSISDVTSLQATLDGKAASSHTHAISDVTGLQTALDGKAASSHTHNASDINAGTLDAARLPAPGTTTLGGVKRNAGSAGQYVNGIDADGNLLYSTPSGGSTNWVLLGTTEDGTSKSTAFTIPFDNTKPQSGEGEEYTEIATTVTPPNASADLYVEVKLWVSSAGVNTVIASIFRDSGADAISSGWVTNAGASYANELSLIAKVAAGSTSSTTFKVRWGVVTSGTVYLNNSGGTSYLGGALLSSMRVFAKLP